MPKQEGNKKESAVVILGKTTSFNGVLKFRETLRVQGKFRGTIEAQGALIVVYGTVVGAVHARDKVDMMSGAEVHGDVTAARLRIADGVLFEGQCGMTAVDKDVEIFSRPAEEIKAELQRMNG